LHIPAAIREIVADRTFTLRIAGSLPEGSVGSLRARGSNAWGFGPLLRTAGIHRYDVFEIHCDLTTGVAVLQRADDEEMSGG
jgi:hypothetical protein